MKSINYVILFFIFSCKIAMAESPLIWNGDFAQSLAPAGFEHTSGKQIRDCGSTIPSAGAGVSAPLGSICQYGSGGIGAFYVKVGASDTNWVDALTASSGWSLLGNAGTGGTAILGTTDAQPFSIRANNTSLLTFGGTNPTISSSISQAPADGIGINQFDFRAYIAPTVSTTNASHTGMFSQLVYDNGNAGFDSTGGSYLANSANFTHNGSGDLSFASIYNGSAGFNSTGTTGQFKGIASENTIASGATVSDYYGMVTGLNTTGGIVPASNSLSLYGNYNNSTIGQANGINQGFLFDGTTTNSQGVTGIKSFINFSDSATTTNGVQGINAGIDLNNTAAPNGINGFNFYGNLRDNSTAGGVNLFSAAINQEDSASNTGLNAFNANIQFHDTTTSNGVTIFNGYAKTDGTAHLDGLTGVQLNPEIEGTSDVDNFTGGAFSGQIRGNSTVDNITGVYINPQMSDSAAVQNFTGLQVNPQVNGTSTLTNALTGVQVNPQGTVLLSGATGVNIDMSQVSLTSGALAGGAQKSGITVNDGAFSSGYNYTVPGAAGFFQINYLGGGPIVANGDPTSAFGFGNNLAHSVILHDDWNLDGSGLGFVDVGFVGSLAFDTGTTMAQWTGALGGAGNPSGAGTLTTAKMFSAAGILPQGGALSVTNMYGFEVNPNLFCLVGTNCWGFYEDTAAAENHMSKLAINTASKKVANTDVALEIGGAKTFLNGRATTAERLAMTPVEGMQVLDTDLDQLYLYSAGAWSAVGSGSGISELTGDVTAGPGSGAQAATVVSVGGETAADVATSVNDTQAATNANTPSTIVKRDGSGDFSAGTITAALSGNASTATALAANPTDCAAGEKATGIDAQGNLTCSAVSLTADVSGTLPVANGGTGASTLTANNVILGNGTSAVQFVAPGTSGNVLTSNGTTWTSAPSASGGYTGTCNIILNAAAGFGSTDTSVRRITNIDQGCADSSVTLVINGTNGNSITANVDGYYCATYKDRGTGVAAITLNASSLTTAPAGMTQSEVLDAFETSSSDAKAVWCGKMVIGDVLRFQASGFTATTNFDVKATFSRMN